MAGYTQLSTGIYGEPKAEGWQTGSAPPLSRYDECPATADSAALVAARSSAATGAEARREIPANNIAHGKTAARDLRLLIFIPLTLSFACLAWMQEMSSTRGKSERADLAIHRHRSRFGGCTHCLLFGQCMIKVFKYLKILFKSRSFMPKD
jgi:hypothetical protein